ncbi:unnamed protein product [Didymodactylos carnosus]|uniref:Uncharacterized protein n=1 Tax=Didymodactylos carnosus TaxID=1234261 RepID=A0A815A4R6_9BILA|nr:unnamed protein product [Didymodactylos carnosus]CAF1251148.1 unnamed protein product [Didymodactylos carnosus]CAF3708359.1 unnamed protein product [Didymodactylos carnosus]CAF4020475.1 unnamed protein product [Didymodactylos carnosus]
MKEQLLACTEQMVIQPTEVHTTLLLQSTGELNGNLIPVSVASLSNLMEFGCGLPKPGEVRVESVRANGGELMEIPLEVVHLKNQAWLRIRD